MQDKFLVSANGTVFLQVNEHALALWQIDGKLVYSTQRPELALDEAQMNYGPLIESDGYGNVKFDSQYWEYLYDCE